MTNVWNVNQNTNLENYESVSEDNDTDSDVGLEDTYSIYTEADKSDNDNWDDACALEDEYDTEEVDN